MTGLKHKLIYIYNIYLQIIIDVLMDEKIHLAQTIKGLNI